MESTNFFGVLRMKMPCVRQALLISPSSFMSIRRRCRPQFWAMLVLSPLPLLSLSKIRGPLSIARTWDKSVIVI